MLKDTRVSIYQLTLDNSVLHQSLLFSENSDQSYQDNKQLIQYQEFQDYQQDQVLEYNFDPFKYSKDLSSTYGFEDQQQQQYHQSYLQVVDYFTDQNLEILQQDLTSIAKEEYSQERMSLEFEQKKRRESFDFQALDLQMRTSAPERVFEIVIKFIEDNQGREQEVQDVVTKVLQQFQDEIVEISKLIVIDIKGKQNNQMKLIVKANIMKNDMQEFIDLYLQTRKKYPQAIIEGLISYQFIEYQAALTVIDSQRCQDYQNKSQNLIAKIFYNNQ